MLIQNRQEVIRCSARRAEALEDLLDLFFGYERSEILEFRKAVEQFTTDLPAVLDALRAIIERAYADNPEFQAAEAFLAHAKETINPSAR